MKRHLSAILAIGLLAASAGAQAPATGDTNAVMTDFSSIFKGDSEKFGYTVGMFYADAVKSKLKTQDVEFDTNAIIRGFTDNLDAGPSLITEAQKNEVLNELNKLIQAKVAQKRKDQAEKGPAFLARNKTEPGVVTLPSGLQYKIITDGTGPIPVLGDEVTVNYRGTFIDGTEFDNSAKRGQPLKTKVQENAIIKGWVEALQLMKTGSKWQVFIPSELAYGSAPRNPAIPPDAVLIFEMELLTTSHPAQMAVTLPPLPTPPPAPPALAVPMTSDIIKVPSAEEMKNGAKIETIKAEDLEKEKAKTNQ